MNKNIKKIAAIAGLATLGVVNINQAVGAVTVPISANTSSAQSVKICRTVTNLYDNVTATFNYTFTAKTTGLTGLPTGTSIAFSNQAPTNHTVSKCTDVDISGVTFADNSPKQILVEVTESTSATGIAADGQKYTLTFDLRNTVDSSSNITGQVASLASIKNSSDTKVDQLDFSSARSYGMMDIKLSKTVKGTAGDTNEYFSFTVNVGGASGTTYSVYGTSAGSGSATSCTAGSNCTIKLKSGESARIGYNGTSSQVAVGTTYTITETGATDYTTTVAVGTGAATTAKTTGQQTVMSVASANESKFVNTKDANVLTGIFNNIWPYVLLGAVSVVAIVYTKKTAVSKKA